MGTVVMSPGNWTLLKMGKSPAKDGKYLRASLHLAFMYHILIENTFWCFEVVKSSAYIPDCCLCPELAVCFKYCITETQTPQRPLVYPQYISGRFSSCFWVILPLPFCLGNFFPSLFQTRSPSFSWAVAILHGLAIITFSEQVWSNE